MKKFNKNVVITLLVAGTIYLLHLSPVSFDAFGTCSGGYKKYTLDKNSEELVNLFLTEQGFNKNTNYKLIPTPKFSPDPEWNNLEWEGRNIYVTLKVEVEGKVYLIDYRGKKYLPGKYAWKITNIDM